MDLVYTYTETQIIFKNITFLKDFNIIEYSILTFLIVFVILFILYFLPILYIIKEEYYKDKEKLKKKELLKQIILQKELEDEILKEIKEKKVNY